MTNRRAATRRAFVAFIALTAFSGCVSPSVQPAQVRISPEQAVINAAESEDGITGVFELVVRGVGRRNGRLFLNSRPDYRDPRNLTIVILPAQEQALEDRLGRTLEDAVFGKAIAVRGTAKTVRIDFRDGDTATGLYYFQTQLELQSARDLTVVGEAWFY